jgi:lysophospholipase L1-like esterase
MLELALQFFTSSYKGQVYDHEFTGGHPRASSPDGSRGEPVKRTREDGEFRVLALGDSVTFGTGVSASDSWPAQLKNQITQINAAASVINAGVPAIRIREMEAAYRDQWSAYSPSLVIVCVSNNMPSFGWIRRGEPPQPPVTGLARASGISETQHLLIKMKRSVGFLCLPSFLSRNSQRMLFWVGLATHEVAPDAPYGPMLAHGWLQGSLDPTIASQAWQQFESDLASLAKVVQRSRAQLVVTHVPARFMLTKQLGDNEKRVPRGRLTIDPTDEIESICARLELDYVDSRKALRVARSVSPSDPLYIPFDFTHLSAGGHRAVAHAVFSRLQELGLVR